MHSWPHGASADAHYVGWRDADGLHLHVFAWPHHPSDRGHGLRTLWRWRQDDSLVVLLARDVLATTAAYDPNDDATRRIASVHAEATDLHLEMVYGRVLENEASEFT
ncbi:hypothetical protein SPRG_21847 [Saprolegnia parasitica CBS 223.65]|uniref:Uncharacterized protein n=1 Tax=Saprolegnia parasitica (strain CBS 223.65) TaxID=695850 RepID=A0A067BSN1_SAPPC|nr:hypothetical protein SPRG_21847 [Saprolegnia parasitica CBS 223.65]KDO17657.1 hypothetical protein SPRG_21847 [Saprolegnia parasitica CBS 223.65]|eukprot:XP_012211633.1 hypothetical protein SPRG_21847 [Saprolegnia parasitica CBS 223.65]